MNPNRWRARHRASAKVLLWVGRLYTKRDSSTLTLQGQWRTDAQPLSYQVFEGIAWVIANDGQSLGVITRNQYNTNSIANKYGDYGSEYSSTSIFNKYCAYGGQYSALSPFNRYSSTPPMVYMGSSLIAYLTINTAMSPRIDPITLIAWLRSDI